MFVYPIYSVALILYIQNIERREQERRARADKGIEQALIQDWEAEFRRRETSKGNIEDFLVPINEVDSDDGGEHADELEQELKAITQQFNQKEKEVLTLKQQLDKNTKYIAERVISLPH